MRAWTKSRRSSPRASRWVWLWLVFPCCEARQHLPVFLADNHAETFGWIARTFEVDDPHVLVLVDAHSDASAAERSEEIREGIRRVPGAAARKARVEAWRREGRLQAYNWIEPLMPRPLDRVMWLPRPVMAEAERRALDEAAARSLDGRLEVEPRSAGEFARRWETVDLKEFTAWEPGSKPVILAVDLDFFAGMRAEEREQAFEAVWERAMDWPGLGGVAFAVSRPWLADDAEADALVKLAADTVRRTRGAVLEIDATPDDRPDFSEQAREASDEGLAVARWDLTGASPALHASLRLLGRRLTVRGEVPGYEAHRGEAVLLPSAGEIDIDGVWRFAAGGEPVIRLDAPAEATGRVRWFALEAGRTAYDLLPHTGLGKGFAESAGRRIYEKRRVLGETEDFQLDPAAWRPVGAGRVRIGAEYETAGGWLPVAEIEVRVRTAEAEGFRGTLSECFGMPYVFGIAGVEDGSLDGVETGWGADCSNLLIHAWRRNGVPLAWGDPGRLREQLAVKELDQRISPDEIERGLVIDFGNHVAALWEDREPLGELGGNDRVLHHLGGVPEVVALSVLAEARPTFSLRMPVAPSGVKVAFAGDVVLAGDAREVIDGFECGESGLFLANLEGIPSLSGGAANGRHDFRFPPERLGWLKERGMDAVSLANNHALDGGAEGLREGLAALKEAGIGSFGAGRTAEEACAPWRTERGEVAIAVFGVFLQEGGRAPDGAVVARLPGDAAVLEREMAMARARCERIIVLVHGGDEYRSRVNDSQRQWAAWLVARGARVVAGAGPHVVQRDEWHGGARILHSLGNAVYPAELGRLGSGSIRVVELP